jgi:hypothetical protein
MGLEAWLDRGAFRRRRRVFQPPADGMLSGLGHEVSGRGVARLYASLAHAFVLDRQDAA